MAVSNRSRTQTNAGLTPHVPKRRPATSEVAAHRRLPVSPHQRSTEALVEMIHLACANLTGSMQQAVLGTNGVLLSAEARLSDAEQSSLSSVSLNLHRMLLIANNLERCAAISQSADWAIVNCEDLLARTVKDVGELLEDTGARVLWYGLPRIFSIDSVLSAVFQELVVNAVNSRAADPLEIRIEAQLQDSGWMFLVADNGIGIDRRHWESIFHPFFTVDPRAWRPGLGLTLARLAVEHLGGKIQVDASDAGGTAFRFFLPGSGSVA